MFSNNLIRCQCEDINVKITPCLNMRRRDLSPTTHKRVFLYTKREYSRKLQDKVQENFKRIFKDTSRESSGKL